MDTTLSTDVNVKPGGVGTGSDDFGSGGGGGGPKDSGEWPPGYSRDDAIEPAKYRIGMLVGLASILMLFVALTSAYIVRQTQGLSNDSFRWVTIDMPAVLWVTTALIVASSITIELARRSLKRNRYSQFNGWITATTVLGLLFVAGQVFAWQQLRAQGIYVNTNPHSSFFYLLTSLHGVHLLGGLAALVYVTYSALRMRISIRRRNGVEVAAMYWHFMDGLWLYIFFLLFFWR